MNAKKIKALEFGLFITLIYIVVTSIVIGFFGLYFSMQNSKKSSKIVQKLYADNIVHTLKERIDGIVTYINFERKLIRKENSIYAEEQLNQIYRVFSKVYLKNSEFDKSYSVIKKELLNFVHYIYQKRAGEYLFIFDKKHKIMFGNQNKILLNLLSNINIKGNSFMNVIYNHHLYTVYFRFFKPMNWYVVYCIDMTFQENKIKNSILAYLSNYRYGPNKHGYIFISRLNKNNPNCKLIEVINPNEPNLIGKCLPINEPDEKGNYFRRKMLKDILSKGYSITTYYYKIPGTKKYGKKISYLILYKPWNWVIGTGFYLEDMGKGFYKEQLNNINGMGKRILISVFIIMIISAAFFFAFFNRIKPEIKSIINFLEKFPEVNKLDIEKFKFFETFFVAKKVNEMAENVIQITKNHEDMIMRYVSITNYMKSCLVVVEKKGKDIYVKDVNSCVQMCMGIIRKSDAVGKNIYEFFRQFPSITKRFEMIFERDISVDAIDIIKNLKNCGYKRYFQSEMFKITEQEAVYIADDITNSVMLYFRNSIERDRLASLIEDIDIGVAIINFEGSIIFLNSKLLSVFEIEGFNIRRLKDLFVSEKSEVRIEKYLEGIRTKKAECIGCVFEIETYRGNRKWIEITAVADNINNEPVIILSMKDITYRYLKEKEIEYISLHDDLTGLYNRRFFKEELKRLFNERSYPLALAIFDIDGLKMVNDLLGHSWGDWLIKKVAFVLKKSVRVVDIPARIGGDEFVLLMINTDLSGIKKCIKRINENLLVENRKSNRPYLSVSIGYAIQRGQFNTPDELFSEADKTMYEEKYSDKRSEELKKIWESIKRINPESVKLHKIEDFLKR